MMESVVLQVCNEAGQHLEPRERVGQVSETVMIDQVVERLAFSFSDLPGDDVERVVRTTHDRFGDSTVREFVPLLVELRSRGELTRMASSLTWSS